MSITQDGHCTRTWCSAILLAALLACPGQAWAYMVANAVSLDKLTAQSDIVFKGTAVSTAPVQDAWFKTIPGFITSETKFRVVSVVKGEPRSGSLVFRHLDTAPQPGPGFYEPQFYHFEIGRTYLVFAARSETGDSFRQLWVGPKTKPDQGMVLCRDANPGTAKTVKDAVWSELTAMLASPLASDVLYAIDQLDQMSAGKLTYDGLTDFNRSDVLAAIRPLLVSPDPQVAQAAIRLVGSHNPYLSDDSAIFWLATVGSVDVPGIGKMDPAMKNVGGELYWKDLASIVDGAKDNSTRALAIRSLGLVREPALQDSIGRWMVDPDPEVRASAVLLLANFPGPATVQRLTALASDGGPQVRASVARASGYSQQVSLVNVLSALLRDKEEKVRQAAAMSLLSFSPHDPQVADVFRANLENEEFKPLFLNALARENPAGYLDALAAAVEQKTEPKNFWGGQAPAFMAWEILFKYLQALPAGKVRSAEFNRYLDAIEKVGDYSSSEPRDIYAFYVQRGMTERARAFRQAAIKSHTYDIDYYFKDVDKNPSFYTRE